MEHRILDKHLNHNAPEGPHVNALVEPRDGSTRVGDGVLLKFFVAQ